MAACDDRQLTEAQRQAGYQNQRTGVQQAVRPFTGRPTVDNLIDYINRELYPAVRASRDKVNDVYLQVTDNAPSGNPLAFYFSTETAAADPTTGRIRLNASPQNTAATVRVSETNGRLVSIAPWLDVMAGGATAPLGVVTMTDAINPARFIRFDLNTMVDQGVYWDLGVTFIESSHPDPFVDDGAVVLGFIPGVGGVIPATVPLTSISPIAADTFLGNITGATAAPVAVPLANVDSASVVYDGASHTFQRPALTGFAAATANSNATTSAEPIVTFSASSNMSNERVLSDGTGSVVDIATPGQIKVNVASPLTDGDKGDITVSASGTVWTIDNLAVTNAKLRDSAALSVIGRSTNTAGDPADIVSSGGDRYFKSSATNTSIGFFTPNIDDFSPIQHNRFIGNISGALAPMSSNDLFALASDAAGGIGWNATTSHFELFNVVDNSVLANVSGSTAIPGPVQLATLAGTALTYDPSAKRFDLQSSASITAVSSDDNLQRAALTGDVTAPQNDNTLTIANNAVTDAKLRDSAALSVIGRSANSIGDPADIIAGSDGDILRRSGTTLGFGAIALTAFPSIADDTFLANITTGSATPVAVPLADIDSASVIYDATSHTYQRAALTGAIAVTQNSNATLFAGIQDGGAATTDRAGLNFIGFTVADDAGNSRINITAPVAPTDGDKGDITVSASGATWTIDNLAVTTGKIANNAVDATKFRQSAAFSVVGNSGSSPTNTVDISTTTGSDHVLRESGGALGFGTLNGAVSLAAGSVTTDRIAGIASNTVLGNDTGSTTNPVVIGVGTNSVLGRVGANIVAAQVVAAQIATNTVSNVNLRQSVALSLVGRSSNSTGNVADIATTAGSGGVLRESGSALSFGTIAAAAIADGAVTLAKQADLAQSRIIGRAEGAGTGVPTALTPTQVVAIVDAESPTWTGSHAFTGTNHTVNVSGVAALESVADLTVASSGGGLALGAGHVIVSPSVSNGDVVINATGGVAINAHATTPVTSVPNGVVEVTGTNVELTSTNVTATASSNVVIFAGTDVTIAAGTGVEVTSPFRIASTFRFDAVLTTATTAADDLVIGSVNVVRFTGAPNPLTGMVPVVSGQTVLLVNAHASSNMGIFNESASSAATSRFAGLGTSRVIRPGEMALVWYDGTSDRWRVLCRDDVDL